MSRNALRALVLLTPPCMAFWCLAGLVAISIVQHLG